MGSPIENLNRRRKEAMMGGGAERIKKQHGKGKLTARERIKSLLDPESFVEIGLFVESRHRALSGVRTPADGVVTGYGTIDGRLVYVYAQDFTVMGGSLGEAHAAKICRIIELALKAGAPLIGLNDSGGARIQEGVDSLKGYGEIFKLNVKASGVIPQIIAIMGPCAGGAVYSPALADLILMVEGTSYMYITGPAVIEAVTGERVSHIELGGAAVQMGMGGNVHLTAENDYDCLALIRRLLSYLPQNNMERPPNTQPIEPAVSVEGIVPDDPRKPYDVKRVIAGIVDAGSFLELQPGYALNCVVGFARMEGETIGVVANQPSHMAGCLDINSSDKISRFVRLCDNFNIPILTLVDTPGFLPGVEQEYGGIIRHGAKIIYAYSEASVPMVTVILRKAYGGAYIAMGSRHLGADIVYAWPTAEIAVMGPEGAARIIYRKVLEKAVDKDRALKEFIEKYRSEAASPYVAASRGYVDDIIAPTETRRLVAAAFKSLINKKPEKKPYKKHGNIPL